MAIDLGSVADSRWTWVWSHALDRSEAARKVLEKDIEALREQLAKRVLPPAAAEPARASISASSLGVTAGICGGGAAPSRDGQF